ncbi:hypothetical protein C4D60_Mb09t21240 [Musa balbisiana]|uniref:Uncharacterized protein n=1 Tax=Musa balbisiana TaxID=52838 RepID=A0A4S8II27_MUSBA|nr:hypothetical protein C4D60_Mb09t21240 [Musa balbisiana]
MEMKRGLFVSEDGRRRRRHLVEALCDTGWRVGIYYRDSDGTCRFAGYKGLLEFSALQCKESIGNQKRPLPCLVKGWLRINHMVDRLVDIERIHHDKTPHGRSNI